MKILTKNFSEPPKSVVVWRVVIILSAAAVLISNAGIVEKIIVLYAAGAFWAKLGSIWSFGLALGFLAAIPLFSLLGVKTAEQPFSIYTYYFLVIGLIQIIFEHKSR